ncbi:MAG: hypothetical protein V3U86_04950 [Acidobacteriota bacterium]
MHKGMQPIILALAGLLALSPTQAEDSEVSDPPQTAPATQPSSNEIELPPSIQNRKQEQRVRSKRPRGRPQRDDRALEILDEMIDAYGGDEHLQGVSSRFIRSRQITGQGMEARETIITEYWKKPNLYRREMDGQQGHSIMAYNGRYGWHDLAETGGGVTIAPRSMNRYFDDLCRDINEPLSHLDEMNHLSYEGEQELDGRAVDVIRVTRPSGKIKILYIDAENRRILQKDIAKYSEPDDIIGRRKFSDFRQVDRAWVPYVSIDGDGELRVEIIDFLPNQAIDDGIFDSPLPPMEDQDL